jgi:hypothetical protein
MIKSISSISLNMYKQNIISSLLRIIIDIRSECNDSLNGQICLVQLDTTTKY